MRTPLAVLFPCICLASIGESIHHGTFALFAESKLSFTAQDIGWAFTSAGIVMALVQGLLVGRIINSLTHLGTLSARIAKLSKGHNDTTKTFPCVLLVSCVILVNRGLYLRFLFLGYSGDLK
ncbi:MAG: hypothetical protein PHF24_05980 [Syntrophomonas sp.]|nr:hypothetical protein [Syntrophomonas sp.]